MPLVFLQSENILSNSQEEPPLLVWDIWVNSTLSQFKICIHVNLHLHLDLLGSLSLEIFHPNNCKFTWPVESLVFKVTVRLSIAQTILKLKYFWPFLRRFARVRPIAMFWPLLCTLARTIPIEMFQPLPCTLARTIPIEIFWPLLCTLAWARPIAMFWPVLSSAAWTDPIEISHRYS